jgi:hypothetical protein
MKIFEGLEQVTMKLCRAISNFHSLAEYGVYMLVNYGRGLFDIEAVSMLSGVEEKFTFDNVDRGPRGVEVVVVSAITVEVLGVGKGATVNVGETDTCCCKPFPRRRYCCSMPVLFLLKLSDFPEQTRLFFHYAVVPDMLTYKSSDILPQDD